MEFHNQMRAEKAIWRPYLDPSDEFTSNQRSVDNPGMCLERAMLRPYYELDNGDRRLLKQRSVESYEREGQYVDSSSVNNVNTERYFHYTENCPQSECVPVWHERYKQTYWQNSFWDNCANSTQKQNEYNINDFVDIRNNVNSLTNVDCNGKGLKSKLYGQMRLENDKMSMDKEILKTYYKRETCYNASAWQNQSEYNPEKVRVDVLIHPTKNLNTTNDITVTENGIEVTQGGQIGLDDNQLLMDKDVLKTYYELEKGDDSCLPNIGEENHSAHSGTDMPNIVNTITNVVNDQSNNNGQGCMEDIYRLVSSYNQTQHVQKHSLDQSKTKLQCKYCKKNIVGKSNLRMHIRTIHEDPFNRPYRCSKCDATCKTNSCLKKHMHSHERVQTFKYSCPECVTGFNNAKKLRTHMKMNRMNMPDLKCDICNLTFKYKGCYKLHQKEHVGVESQVNTQLYSRFRGDFAHEDITTNVNGRVLQDGEVGRENITDTLEVFNIANILDTTRTDRIQSNDRKQASLKDTQYEFNRDTIDKNSMLIQSDQKLKVDVAFDLTDEVNPQNSNDAIEPERDGENMNENIHREQFINSNYSESKTACEEQHTDTVRYIIDKTSIGNDENYIEKFILSKRNGDTCIVNGHLEQDSENNDEDGTLVIENIYTAEGGNTSIFSMGGSCIDIGDSSGDGSRRLSMGRDNCAEQGVEKELDEGTDIGVFDYIEPPHRGPSSGHGQHPDKEEGNKNIQSKGKTKTRFNNILKTNKVFKCDICEKTVSSQKSLKRHKGVHLGQKDYYCDICGKAFTLKQTLENHIRKHYGEKPYKCEQCDKAFASSSQLATHRRAHSQLKPFKCEICSCTFKHNSHFCDHNKYAHATTKAFSCHVCEATFRWRSAYEYHLKIHSGDNKFQCHHCNKVYCTKDYLNKHIKSVHEKTHVKPYHCGKCGASFQNRYRLKRHMTTHDKQPALKPTLKYVCAHCNAAFQTSKYLRLHMNMHKTGISSV